MAIPLRLQPVVQAQEITLQVLPVLFLGDTIHPYRSAQPHSVKYLDDILGYIMSHEGVWQTTADDIAEYYIENYYDRDVAHASQFNK